MYEINITNIFHFLTSFWQLIQGAMALDPDAFRTVQVRPSVGMLTWTVLILAGWFGRTRRQKQAATTVQETFNVKEPEDIDHYVVYLSGIGDISGETLEAKEELPGKWAESPGASS